MQGDLPPAIRRRPDIGPDLSRVITKMMALEPARRYPTAAAAGEALAAIARGAGIDDAEAALARYLIDPDRERARQERCARGTYLRVSSPT